MPGKPTPHPAHRGVSSSTRWLGGRTWWGQHVDPTPRPPYTRPVTTALAHRSDERMQTICPPQIALPPRLRRYHHGWEYSTSAHVFDCWRSLAPAPSPAALFTSFQKHRASCMHTTRSSMRPRRTISALLVSAPNPDTLAVLRLTLRLEPGNPFARLLKRTGLKCWRATCPGPRVTPTAGLRFVT